MKHRNFYTKEKCKELALSCNSKKEFREKFNSAYQRAYKKKWLDEICIHMKILNNKKNRDIYAIKSDLLNIVYVGLSYDAEERYRQHWLKGTQKVKQILDSIHELVIHEKNLPLEVAIKQEQYWISFYKSKGFSIANIVKAGSIGCPIERIWTKERVKEEALKVKNRTELYRKFPGAYDAAQHNKWLDEIFAHLPRTNEIRKTEINGELLSISEIAKKYGKTKTCISKRYNKGKRGLELIQ